MKTIYKILIFLWGAGLLVGIGLLVDQRPELGSVGVTSEYNSTTTASTGLNWFLAKKGAGAFGSFILSVPLTSSVTIYDATTTNKLLRNSLGTSSMVKLAAIPAGYSTTTMAYVFDSVFNNGLLVVFDAANAIGSTTITWR